MNKYIIIPGCSDLNRGDQALVWETKRLAEEAGHVGEFYLTSERNEPVKQSEEAGLKIIHPILEHPSRKFKSKENIHYTKTLKIKWGFVALGDFIGSMLLLWKPTRAIAKHTASEEKREQLKLFEESKAIFMKGGGLLQTYGGLSSTYSMYFWTYPILLAHKLKKPVYVMPNSFGPFEGPLVKHIARKALKGCKVLTSRETLSQAMVKDDLGLPINNYADLAFMLLKSDIDLDAVRAKYDIPTERKLVAITMRPYRFPGSSNPEEAYLTFKNEMAEFIRWLYSKGLMPIVVEHTLAINAHENDGACIKDVISMLKPEEYRLISDPSYDCHDLKAIYGMCDYIVGTRFHSVIFSFGSEVPGIAIAYTGNKSQGIMHDIGLDDYVVSIDQVKASVLEEKFQSLLSNESNVKAKIRNYRKKAEEDWNRLLVKCKA